MAYPLWLGTARRLIPLYIRNQYSPQRTLAAIQSRFDLRIPRNTFYANYREIQRSFSFREPLRRLLPTLPVPISLTVTAAHPQPRRYEYLLAFEGKDPKTGESFTRYATTYSDRRLSVDQAHKQLRAEQAAWAELRPVGDSGGGKKLEEEAPASNVAFEKVTRVKI